MTGYTVHSGTSDQYASGWDAIFRGDKPAPKPAKPAKGAKKPAAKKKAAAKKAKKSK